MSDTLSTRADSTDTELITAVRGGDTDAYGELFGRHRDAAHRLARQLVHGPDADDLVAESFIRVLSVLQAGKGPDEFFRAYLLTSLRRLHIDRIRSGSRVRPTGDEAELDRAVEFVDPAEMRFEHSAAASAFGSLPERWQLVLWHLDVEGQRPAAIAPLLGMSANSVSALAYRAREGLRQAYLQGHLAPTLHESCRRTTGMLGAHVRQGLSARDTTAVDRHLDDCSRCTGLYLELREVNGRLSGVLGPALLGSAFAGYAAATAATAGVATIGAGTAAAVGLKVVAGGAVKLAIEPVKLIGTAVAGAGTQGVVAAAVLTTVATAGTVAVTTDFGTTAQDQSSASAPPAAGRAPSPPAVSPAPTPTPSASPTPSPSAGPSVEPTATPSLPVPTAAPPIVPTPEPTADPTPSPEPTATPTPEPIRTTPPTPPPDPIVPTDYGIGAYTITNDDSLLQRRFTIPVTAATTGRAADQSVTITVQFTRPVQFRGVVSPGWDCGGAVRDQSLSTLTCTSTLPAGQGATFIAKARGIRPDGTISVSSAGDPQPANDSASFQSGPYLLLL